MSRRAEELLRELNYAIAKDDEGAPCEGQTDLFFPETAGAGYTPSAVQAIHRNNELMAKITCASCPFKVMCAEYALEAVEEWGIWGGLTAEERRAIRKG